MEFSKSCGAVVFTRTPEGIRYVIVQENWGFYGFPKGHREPGESERQTALREIYEETHIRPRILPDFYYFDEFLMAHNGRKKLTVYFLAEYEDQPVEYQQEELLGAGLYSYEEAMELLCHRNKQEVLTMARDYILSHGMGF